MSSLFSVPSSHEAVREKLHFCLFIDPEIGVESLLSRMLKVCYACYPVTHCNRLYTSISQDRSSSFDVEVYLTVHKFFV